MRYLIVLLALFAVIGAAAAQAEDDALVVDAGEMLGPISPYVYGTNLGHHASLPLDLLPEAQALGITYVRYGGGDSDRQNLRGPTIDLFAIQAEMLGAEPAMTVRLLGGTPEQAAEMVRYANSEKGHNIRYWSIGNEPNLFEGLMGVPYTTEDLNREWRAMAEAMLEVDPDIFLVGPDITQYVVLNAEPGNIQYLENVGGGHPRDRDGRDWLQEFLRANGDLVDIVAIHRYPFPGAGTGSTGTATVEGLRQTSREWDIAIPNLRQIIRDSAGRDIPIAITELNSDSDHSPGGEAGLDTHFNAIWLADVLGRLIRQQVEIVAYWDIQGGNNRTWGLLSASGVRPTYYVYIMYGHFGTELVHSEAPDDLVTVYAALNDDGALTVMVVNMADDEQTRPLSLRNFTPSGEAEVWRFDPEHHAENIGTLAVDDGTLLTLPGQSMTLFVIPGA
jgi:hypothetical protein